MARIHDTQICWTIYYQPPTIQYSVKVRKMFLAADLDGDGKLSKEEWLGVLRQAGVTVRR